MKVKKYLKITLSVFLISLMFASSVGATTTTLFRHSASTFVTSYHPDNYFADTYTGVASVKGTDRVAGSNGTYYFTWTRITYDVQGTFSSKTAYSASSSDTNTVKETLTVKDKWNDGSKTRALHNYSTKFLNSTFSSPDEK